VLFSLPYRAICVNEKYLLDQERKRTGDLLSLSTLAGHSGACSGLILFRQSS